MQRDHGYGLTWPQIMEYSCSQVYNSLFFIWSFDDQMQITDWCTYLATSYCLVSVCSEGWCHTTMCGVPNAQFEFRPRLLFYL